MNTASRMLLSAAAALVLLAAACSDSEDAPDRNETEQPDQATDGHHDTAGADHHDDTADDDAHDHHDDAGTHDHDHAHGAAGEPTRYDADVADAVQTITVDAVDGAPMEGVRRLEVDLGSVVALMVTSDLAEEVHVHGYDILRAVSDGHPAHFAFTAEIPGVFEVEFEGSGRLLLLLEIS